MDKIDKKIMLELDKDPRASFNQIGKAARVSKEVAQYRYKQLLKNRILTGFFAYLNTPKMGYITNKILVKYKSVNKEIQKSIINHLLSNKYVAWAGNFEGTWDLVITTICPSTKDFVDFYEKFFQQFGKHFKQKEILLAVNISLLNDKYLADGKLLYNNQLYLHPEKVLKIDDVDKKIMLELSLDARKTFTDIGKKVGLTYSAVAQRYKKLIDNNMIITLKPRIDFRKLGYSYYHLFIEIGNEEIRKKIVQYYTEYPDCILIMEHCGFYSLHLEFVLDKDKMKDVVMDFREKFGKDIMSYEPLFMTEEYTMKMIR